MTLQRNGRQTVETIMERHIEKVAEALGIEVRCPKCRLLLGIKDDDGHLEVRWKELSVIVDGGVTTIRCRRCRAICNA